MAVKYKTQDYTDTLDIFECDGCGVTYGLTQSFVAARRKDHRNWTCPSGCVRHFPQQNTEEKLRSELAATEGKAAAERARRNAAEAEAAAERRRSAAARGQVTKIKNRIAKGVCPVPGCQRSGFANQKMLDHIENKHPSWRAEHAHEIEAMRG